MPVFSKERSRTSLPFVLCVSATLLLSGCAGNQAIETDPINQAIAVDSIEQVEKDPYEGFNRSMYSFNKGLDSYVSKPISDAYLWATPRFLRTGVANFFSNLNEVNVVLNDVMQGKGGQGAEDTGRFLINTTLGLGGLFDVATRFGFEKHEEDFAQTLAVWGVPQGPYLVLPVMGPSSGRGVPGGIFDTMANPATYIGAPIQLVQMLNARANAEGSLNFIDEAALDPYVFTREAFLQHRKYLITDGQSEISDDLLDLDDGFYDDEWDEENLTLDSDISLELLPKQSHQFGEVANSFDKSTLLFDKAAISFKEADEKLDRLLKTKFYR